MSVIVNIAVSQRQLDCGYM